MPKTIALWRRRLLQHTPAGAAATASPFARVRVGRAPHVGQAVFRCKR